MCIRDRSVIDWVADPEELPQAASKPAASTTAATEARAARTRRTPSRSIHANLRLDVVLRTSSMPGTTLMLSLIHILPVSCIVLQGRPPEGARW